MKELRLWELVLLVVMIFVVGSIGFFWYRIGVDKAVSQYMQTKEVWINQATGLINTQQGILNENIKNGRLVSPIVTPQMQPPPPQYPPKPEGGKK